jgi:hypothetical protein
VGGCNLRAGATTYLTGRQILEETMGLARCARFQVVVGCTASGHTCGERSTIVLRGQDTRSGTYREKTMAAPPAC